MLLSLLYMDFSITNFFQLLYTLKGLVFNNIAVTNVQEAYTLRGFNITELLSLLYRQHTLWGLQYNHSGDGPDI